MWNDPPGNPLTEGDSALDTLAQFVYLLLFVYSLCVFSWALISWLPMISPQLAYNSTVASVRNFLDSVVLPYVRLFRFVPPVRMGGAMLDMSALVAILVLLVAQRVLPEIIASLG